MFQFLKRFFKRFLPSEQRLRAMYRLGVAVGRAQLERELKLVERPVPSQLPTNVHPLERSPETEPLQLLNRPLNRKLEVIRSRSGTRLHMFNAQKRATIHLQQKGFQLPPARPGKPIELLSTGIVPVPGPDDAA